MGGLGAHGAGEGASPRLEPEAPRASGREGWLGLVALLASLALVGSLLLAGLAAFGFLAVLTRTCRPDDDPEIGTRLGMLGAMLSFYLVPAAAGWLALRRRTRTGTILAFVFGAVAAGVSLLEVFAAMMLTLC